MSVVQSENGNALVDVISTAIQIPGVKVNREAFLREQFKNASPEFLSEIIKNGPVAAKCSRRELRKIARRIVNERTLVSSGVSFAAGVPGGFAMAATIPADVLQFYGVALRLAQEIAYLYGEEDLWCSSTLDSEKVTNQLILYCGVMLGASGASQTVRVVSSSLAKQALKKLPQKALTKTFYYPIVKSIAKALGAKMTKEIFAEGVAKAVPVMGGVVSGGITLVTMRPMGMRLIDVLDEAHFSYSIADFKADWNDIEEEFKISDDGGAEVFDSPVAKENAVNASNFMFEEMKQAKQLLDAGIITSEEFSEIKARIIAKI